MQDCNNNMAHATDFYWLQSHFYACCTAMPRISIMPRVRPVVRLQKTTSPEAQTLCNYKRYAKQNTALLHHGSLLRLMLASGLTYVQVTALAMARVTARAKVVPRDGVQINTKPRTLG